MATGNYGTVRPADVSVDDIEIFYSFTPTREALGSVQLQTIPSSQVLIPATNPNGVGDVLGGLYTLKLPTSIFGSKGFYSIIIQPKQIRTAIHDCGVLIDMPSVKGLIFDMNQVNPSSFQNRFENDQLIGYRVEYLDSNGSKIPNFYRIITSNNRALPVPPTAGTSAGWSFNDNASTTFCTVTPSSAPAIKPNAIPEIGNQGQDVIITNTFFNPVMLELEMVEYDHETLAYALFSNQTKSLEDGIYTIYNFGNEIYKQYNLYEVKDQFTGKPLFEVREKKSTIDPNKDFDTIVNFPGHIT